jgi:hypothetical protein
MKQATGLVDFKAVSLNLMHSDTKITDNVYGMLSDVDVQGRISRLGDASALGTPSSKAELLARFQELLGQLKSLPD